MAAHAIQVAVASEIGSCCFTLTSEAGTLRLAIRGNDTTAVIIGRQAHSCISIPLTFREI